MAREKAFPLGRVILQHHKKDDWRVVQEFAFYWEEKDITIHVGENWLTDHATIPSFIPDNIIDNTGPISNGAVPHDMIYKLMKNNAYLPFRCVYDILDGRYWSKQETDQMFDAANRITEEMNWLERTLAKWTRLNVKAKWQWMSKEEWDRAVFTHIRIKLL